MSSEALDPALSADPPYLSRLPAEQASALSALHHHMSGLRFAAAKNFPAALAQFDAALGITTAYAEAWFHRGMVLHDMQRLPEAYEAFAQATLLAPCYRDAEEKLAETADVIGRPAKILTPWVTNPRPSPYQRGVQWLKTHIGGTEAVDYLPSDPNEAELRDLILRAPASAALAAKMGRVLSVKARRVEAELFLRYALALEPWSGEAATMLCVLLEGRKARRHEAKFVAMEALRAGSLDPRLAPLALWNALHAADWNDYDRLLEQSIASLRVAPAAVGPFTALHFTNDLNLLRRCSETFCRVLSNGTPPLERVAPRQHARLTIGYLSPDFRDHACARLFAELFELHERDRYRVVGYSTWPDDKSTIGRRIRASFDRFNDLIGLKDDAAADRIRSDGVDILVDLSGNTVGGRPRILALRPAAVQVTFLGYPGTVGSTGIDYAVVDKTVAPQEHAAGYSEALVYMPNSYQVNDRKRRADNHLTKRSDVGLPNDAVVYCCFNTIQKITPAVFAVWMRILVQVPNSVLWLYAINPLVATNLRKEAARFGIEGERLIFCEHVPNEQHLARYRHADLFLDTQPYGAHTTASDALWMGCPVVTLLGAAFAGRVGASLLQAAGLPELIVDTWGEYESLAVTVGRDREFRQGLRQKVIANRSTCALFDTPAFCRQLEWAFEAMWSRYMAGEKPASFDVPSEIGGVAVAAVAKRGSRLGGDSFGSSG
jgi:predicted O-linked N-acetylglucosamine transferase (SPINDLY family)